MILFTGCERAPLETEPPAPTFSQIQTQIFSQSCALPGCHQGPTAPQGLDLSEGNAYENLVNVPSNEVPELLRVEPGNPDDSYLILKLEGSDRIVGSQMPLGREPLSDETIQIIREWIAAGAPRRLKF